MDLVFIINILSYLNGWKWTPRRWSQNMKIIKKEQKVFIYLEVLNYSLKIILFKMKEEIQFLSVHWYNTRIILQPWKKKEM